MKAPKKQEKANEPALEFGTPDWMAEREEELDSEMAGHDFSKDVNLRPRWDGDYKFRLIPIVDKKDWLRPSGEHWNVFPGPDGKMAVGDGCPHLTWRKPCPICFAVDKAIAEKKATGKEMFGQGGIGVQRVFLVRILLLEAKLIKMAADKAAPPHFTDLPDIKVLECSQSVAKKLRDLIQDDDYGWAALMHPSEGVVLKLTKDSAKPGTERYALKPLRETFALPEEWFEYETEDDVKRLIGLNDMPDLTDFLPKTTTEELMGKIEKHANEINPFLANYNLSIDVGRGSQKALPAGGEEEEERPSGKDTMAALRERMRKNKEKGA
jgi:hypothetical protein